MVKKIFKRKYEHKLIRRAIDTKENREFLISRLKQEWNKIEKEVAKDRRKQKLYNTVKETGKVLGFTILGLTMVCGVLVIAAVAPNIFSAFGRLGRRRYFAKDSLRKEITYLKRRGYIDVVWSKTNDVMEVKLTGVGKERVARQALGDFKIVPLGQWDGVWRIVIFDIPEKNKWAREGFRERLKHVGFHPLQKSTFIFPYPCREEIEFLGRLYDVSQYVRFIETSSISLDSDFRDAFSI